MTKNRRPKNENGSKIALPAGMLTFRNIAQLTGSLLAILVLGSLGFVWLEGWTFFDALYMTVTTLTTVGYGEVHPLSRLGQVYNMVLILAGMGVLLYIVTSLARVVVEGEIDAALGKRKLLKRIKKLSDHYIICGFGRIGEIIARQLKQRDVPLVVVENNPDDRGPAGGSRVITLWPGTPPGKKSRWKRASSGPRAWWRWCIPTPAMFTSP